MNSERIFTETQAPPRQANRQRHAVGIEDNRPAMQQQRNMITGIRQGTSRLAPLQRVTDISYTTQEIKANPGANPVTVGREMNAKLDPTDQRQGSTPCGSAPHDALMGGLPADFIRGHLLNHNLGGPGLWFNMFPISGRANHLHTYAAEEEVKELLIHANQMGNGTKVYYNVAMIPQNSDDFINNPSTRIITNFCSRSHGQFVTPYQSMDFISHTTLPGNLNQQLAGMGYGAVGAGQRGVGAANHFSVNAATDQVLEGGNVVGTITWNRPAAAIPYP